MKKLSLALLLVLTFCAGFLLRQYTLYYRVNCDTSQYSTHWKSINDEPENIECLHTNVKIGIERNFYNNFRLVMSEVDYLFYKLVN